MTATPDMKKLAYKFLNSHRLAALATVDEQGNSHVAPLFCTVRKTFDIYFSTRVEGRKFNNLMRSPNVSMSFTDEADVSTIQLSGLAERVDNLELEQEILYDLARLKYQDPNWPMPALKLFEKGATSELAIIKVTPTEMTYASFATSKPGKYKPFFKKVL
jgi:uncharacterized pyridoxamine 5'-phosphate oxidase family protein